MGREGSIEITEIAAEGPLYQEERALRGRVLREPLGMGPEVEVFPFELESLHFVAMEGKRVVGCVLFHPRGREGRLYQMAVLKSHRGRGIGRHLVRFLEERVCSLGFSSVFLHSRDYVREYYEGLGYRCDGEPFIEIGIRHFKMSRLLARAE